MEDLLVQLTDLGLCTLQDEEAKKDEEAKDGAVDSDSEDHVDRQMHVAYNDHRLGRM